ncbi:DUF354 domain-containing protein [Negadavirga shengliensis]|uniref:DUF354 domain-containing protein n=1 Tax=Negadavirga shengliensis TaxID=1389218 RepID=A0ABV9T3W9_9BACT
MKIWIDFINSPQVSFFDPLVKELTAEGHEFVFTCRDSANTVQLVQQRNWVHTIVGDRAERSFFRKVFAFPLRVLSLYRFLKSIRPDIGICQSSFYLPITAKLLGFPSIYTNDNEHALGNIPSFYFASRIFVPENISLEKIAKQGAKKRKLKQYPGIKEGVYLWVKGLEIQALRRHPDCCKRIYVRPEPQTAQYYSGKLNFMDDVLIELSQKYPVTVLVRDEDQLRHYSHEKFSKLEVPLEPIPFDEVATKCMLFIGAGGSMTREMAMVGVPTISVYQGELLDVDRFLIQENFLIHKPDLNVSFIEKMIQQNRELVNSGILIEKGKEAYKLFKTELLNFKNND